MTRGRQPAKAHDEALPIAEKRGLVMRYQHRRGNICDFSVMSPGLVTFVCVMRLLRLSSTPEDIIHDFSFVIGQLRFIASLPAISRELWLCTPRGAWRFFRICDNSIFELGRDGMPLTAAGAGPAKKLEPAMQNGKKSITISDPATGKNPEPGKKSVPYSVPAEDPEPEKDLKRATIPEKIPEKISEPVTDPGPANDPQLAPGPEKIPDIIRKFLKRRKSGHAKDPGSA
jgi:hypothetical protein